MTTWSSWRRGRACSGLREELDRRRPDDDEYNRIVHGVEHDLKSDTDIVPDDASSLTESADTDDSADEAAAASDEKVVDLGKKDGPDEVREKAAETEQADAGEQPKKTDGESDAK